MRILSLPIFWETRVDVYRQDCLVFSREAAPRLEYLLDIVNTGTHKEMDMCFELTNKHCHVVIYSPEKNEVVALFLDTTDSVQTHLALDHSENCSRISLPIYRSGWKSMTKTDSW